MTRRVSRFGFFNISLRPSSSVVRRPENPILPTRRHPVYFLGRYSTKFCSLLWWIRGVWRSVRGRRTAGCGFSDVGGSSIRLRVSRATFDFLKAAGSTLPKCCSSRIKKYTRVWVNITRADNTDGTVVLRIGFLPFFFFVSIKRVWRFSFKYLTNRRLCTHARARLSFVRPREGDVTVHTSGHNASVDRVGFF